MAEHEMLQTKAKTKAGAKTNANAGVLRCAQNDRNQWWAEVLLEEGEDGEEEEPEQAHGVPVPGGTVDEDLAVFELA